MAVVAVAAAIAVRTAGLLILVESTGPIQGHCFVVAKLFAFDGP